MTEGRPTCSCARTASSWPRAASDAQGRAPGQIEIAPRLREGPGTICCDVAHHLRCWVSGWNRVAGLDPRPGLAGSAPPRASGPRSPRDAPAIPVDPGAALSTLIQGCSIDGKCPSFAPEKKPQQDHRRVRNQNSLDACQTANFALPEASEMPAIPIDCINRTRCLKSGASEKDHG